jgi:LmbE family N-acetylglucosaminyl deacetylase
VFTQGETSTLGSIGNPDELKACRRKEFEHASQVLGLTKYALHSCPDGHLTEVPLVNRVRMLEGNGHVDALLAFDETGITGHRDHIAATEAAKVFAINHNLPLYLWTLPERVANTLNKRFGTSFQGRPENQITITLDVTQERERQWQAICCHESQANGLNVVRTRLELLGNKESLIESYIDNR